MPGLCTLRFGVRGYSYSKLGVVSSNLNWSNMHHSLKLSRCCGLNSADPIRILRVGLRVGHCRPQQQESQKVGIIPGQATATISFVYYPPEQTKPNVALFGLRLYPITSYAARLTGRDCSLHCFGAHRSSTRSVPRTPRTRKPVTMLAVACPPEYSVGRPLESRIADSYRATL